MTWARAVNAVAAVILLAGIGLSWNGDAPAPAESLVRHVSAQGRLPMPVATARRLPAGVFYLLVAPNGPAIPSYDIWRVDNSGREVQLTHSGAISDMGVSKAGIVMADAAKGADELARLTAHGPQYLPGNHCAAPVISTAGKIACVKPPSASGPFKLVFKTSFWARPQVIHRQLAELGGLAWGPLGQIAALSGSHPPGTTGPRARLLVVKTSGSKRIVPTGFTQLSNVVWGPKANLAVANWHNAGEVITSNGDRQRLPSTWTPRAWNPAGTTLLVQAPGRPGTVGLWSSRHPSQVTRIGSLNRGLIVWVMGWLAHRAPLLPAGASQAVMRVREQARLPRRHPGAVRS